jgi:RecA-family ATPase
LPKFDTWEDLREEDLKELKIIIPGILNQGAKMTVGGASKAGKTWLLMDLAWAIATGRPF